MKEQVRVARSPQRVRFKPDTWRVISNYEINISGEMGTVVALDEHCLSIKLDRHIEDLDEWDNKATWYRDEFTDEEWPGSFELLLDRLTEKGASK